MKAIRMYGSSGHATLSLDEIAIPKPAPGEVLIQVHATAVTTGELEWPTTWHTPEGAPRVYAVPGNEFSGVVEEVGPNTEGFKRVPEFCDRLLVKSSRWRLLGLVEGESL